MSTPHKLIKLCKVDLKKKDTYMTIHVQTNIIIHTHTHTQQYTHQLKMVVSRQVAVGWSDLLYCEWHTWLAFPPACDQTDIVT